MARAESEAKGLDLIICDGAPGIGCPVISSLTGTNLAVIVTEPTPSGRHDLERISDLCRHFRIPAVIIVNKYDLFREEADRIEALSRDRGMDVIARVPFDPAVVAGMVRGLVIGEENGGPAAEAIRSAWREIAARAGR
jgi:MinD superfamily P-loop ATPase